MNHESTDRPEQYKDSPRTDNRDSNVNSNIVTPRQVAYQRYLFAEHFTGWIYWKQVAYYYKMEIPNPAILH